MTLDDLPDLLRVQIAVHPVTDCWEWTGTRLKGYGQTYYGMRPWSVHRLVWTLANGPIERRRIICHRCHNKACCNPAHTYAGTALDNARDERDRYRPSTS